MTFLPAAQLLVSTRYLCGPGCLGGEVGVSSWPLTGRPVLSPRNHPVKQQQRQNRTYQFSEVVFMKMVPAQCFYDAVMYDRCEHAALHPSNGFWSHLIPGFSC